MDGAAGHQPQLQRFNLPSSNFHQVSIESFSIFLPQGQLVGLPGGLSYSLVSRGKVSSLKELCLRRLHSLLPSSLSLSVATTPGLALHLVSVHRPPRAPKSGSPPGFPPGSSPPAPPHLNHPPSTASLHYLGLPASLVSLLSAGNTCILTPRILRHRKTGLKP